MKALHTVPEASVNGHAGTVGDHHFARRLPQAVVPAAITASTCQDVIGWTWRYTVATAIRLGVPVLGEGRRRLIRVDTLMAALEREALVEAPPTPIEELADDEQRRQMLASLGLREARR